MGCSGTERVQEEWKSSFLLREEAGAGRAVGLAGGKAGPGWGEELHPRWLLVHFISPSLPPTSRTTKLICCHTKDASRIVYLDQDQYEEHAKNTRSPPHDERCKRPNRRRQRAVESRIPNTALNRCAPIAGRLRGPPAAATTSARTTSTGGISQRDVSFWARTRSSPPANVSWANCFSHVGARSIADHGASHHLRPWFSGSCLLASPF